MLLIVFLLFFKFENFSCIFDTNNKNEQDLFDEINRERKTSGLTNLQIHLTLQLAAEKRCANYQQLIDSYHRMLTNTYRNDDWPKQEQLNKIFPLVSETIYLHGLDIRNDIFDESNLRQKDFVYIGISQQEYANVSAKCFIYGSSNNVIISNNRRLLRLLYILIGCGILLLVLIVFSIINDRRRAKLKQQFEEQMIIGHRPTVVPKKSMVTFSDRERKSSTKRGDINRMTMGRLGSVIDQRSSAVHSFFQSPK